MEFIRKNIVLVVFLALGVVASGVLIWLALGKHSSMREAKAAVEERKERIEKLNQARPRPMKENVENINKDVVVYSAKLDELHCIFGKVFQKALEAFVKELDPSITVQQMRTELLEHWGNAMRKETSPSPVNAPRMVFRRFLEKKNYDVEKVQRARRAFAALAANETTEPITTSPNAVDDCILDAFGYPRVMTDIRCQNYLVGMQQRLLDFLDHTQTEKTAEGKEEVVVKPVLYSERVEHFTFDSYASIPPPNGNIPHILRHCRLIEDLCLHIKAAQVSRIEDLKRDSAIFGVTPVQSDEYVKYTYTLTVTGNLDSIRALLNEMAAAYKRNRVYVIKKVELSKVVDGALSIGDAEKKPAATISRNSIQPKAVNRRNMKPGDSDDGEGAESPKPLEYWEKPEYPQIVIGEDKECRAVITFDYYLYVGDEIKLKP